MAASSNEMPSSNPTSDKGMDWSPGTSTQKGLLDCPEEVLERIFAHLGFKVPSDADNAPLFCEETTISGIRLVRNPSNIGAMGLALSSRRFLPILSRTFQAIRITTREGFGRGSDAECRALVSVAGPNLHLLSIEDSKHVGAATLHGLIRHCPHLAVLDLTKTPSIGSEELAAYIEHTGHNLQSLCLDSVHARDDVLLSVANFCTTMRDLRLLDLDSTVSADALKAAVSKVAPSVRSLRLSALFGRGLSIDAITPSSLSDDGEVAFPCLQRLDLTSLGWMSGADVVTYLLRIAKHCPGLAKLSITPRTVAQSPFLDPEQIQKIQREAFPLFREGGALSTAYPRGDVPTYGFDKIRNRRCCGHQVANHGTAPNVAPHPA